ncbi:hypothetical protein FOA52_009108 [Chlamydomonas sp. UWO 241]|nr:hypothetical protein FOA52_009108 [Chlamydomonas sp. UWO 241]
MAAPKVAREWFPPLGAESAPDGSVAPTSLVLYNSLLDEKVPFVPADGPGSKQITWYTCGPTVYDVSHVGHARNYLTFDIIRRVLEDYFGYNCMFVMNVTDVDDKIILRARRNYLLAQYREGLKSGEEAKAFALQALQRSHDKQSKKVAAATTDVADAEKEVAAGGDGERAARKKKDEFEVTVKNEEHKLRMVTDALAVTQVIVLTGDLSRDVGAVIGASGDYVAEALDAEQGSSVTDGSIYRAHAAKYEADFFDDLQALGCRNPDVLTRVSEYIPEIISYVEKIIANGMAYESNGSVYFDTRSFRGCGHTYGKLKPWAVGSALLAAESEANFETSEKRSPTDFALWKASKPGEPFWASPWGAGRPGWHIECSAMASSILGAKMDVHTGGEDLKFPHHDNELAQAEAFYHDEGCRQWVNYFLHAGHLEIEGLKMSKSLKNFISIKEALKTYTPRQLRLMFVLQPWNKPMMYGDAARAQMKARESQLKNFFQNIRAHTPRPERHNPEPWTFNPKPARAEMKARESQLKNFFQNIDVATRGVNQTHTIARWEADEMDLQAKLAGVQRAVHERLCDNVDTSGAMNCISDLVRSVNTYLAKKEAAGPEGAASNPAQPLMLRKAAAYVTRILSVFGIVPVAADTPGFGSEGASAGGDGGAVAASYLDTFAAFRDEVRSLARAKAEPKDILAVCDRVRDTTLVDMGVRLEDKADGHAVWKLDDPAVMKAEQVERARDAAEAATKKLATKLSMLEKEREKFERLMELPAPAVSLSDKYKFDDSGEPSHDKDGVALEGKSKDKAKKDVEKAKKALEPLAKKLSDDPDFMPKLVAEIATLQAQIAKLTA